MTDTQSSRPGVDTSRTAYGTEPVRTGWTGWVAFASTMMILVGTFQVIQGLVGIFDVLVIYAVTVHGRELKSSRL